MKHRAVILLLFLAFSSVCRADPQIGDLLVDAEGKKKFVYDFSITSDHRAKLEEWKLAQLHGGAVVSPANLDGFYADLVIRDGQLYLTRLQVDARVPGKGVSRVEVPLKVIFHAESPVPAAWFSGELKIYHGAGTGYSHIRSRATVLSFQKGAYQSTEEIQVGG